MSTIYVENFMLVSETAQGWYYSAALSVTEDSLTFI